jgi:hypothetical protein
MRKDIEELKENFEELGLRTAEILDFKVLAKSVDQDRYLKDDFELVDLDKFREIQNTLLNEGLFETACKNFRNLTDEIDLIPNKLNNNIEKILLGIEQLHLIIEKDLMDKNKAKEKAKEIPQESKPEEAIPETKPSEIKEPIITEQVPESEEELTQTEKEAENDALYEEAEEDEI